MSQGRWCSDRSPRPRPAAVVATPARFSARQALLVVPWVTLHQDCPDTADTWDEATVEERLQASFSSNAEALSPRRTQWMDDDTITTKSTMFNNLKISTRLVGAFALLVALLMAIGALSVSQTVNVRTQLVDITDRRMDAIATLGQLRDEANFQARAIRNVALKDDAAFVESELKSITASREQVTALYGKADEVIQSAKGKASLVEMQNLRLPFGATLDKFTQLTRSGQRSEALTVLFDEVRPAQLAYFKAIDDAVSYQDKAAADASAAALS
ncbi:MAG: hypothetical protein EON93_08780 [Burkholderiales bacterium]|nr:MAG: hypothetical protein EON93_08780 [Burkholderiales bacterium]